MWTVSQYSDFMRRVGNWWFMLGFFSKEWRKETSCFCWCWLRILMKRPIVIMLHCILHPWLHPQNSKCNLSFFQQIQIFLEPSSQDILGTWGCWRQIFSEKTEIKKSLSTWFFVVWSDTHSGPTFYLVFILLLYLHKHFLSFMPLTRFSSRYTLGWTPSLCAQLMSLFLLAGALFIQASFLPLLLVFLLIRMNQLGVGDPWKSTSSLKFLFLGILCDFSSSVPEEAKVGSEA